MCSEISTVSFPRRARGFMYHEIVESEMSKHSVRSLSRVSSFLRLSLSCVKSEKSSLLHRLFTPHARRLITPGSGRGQCRCPGLGE